MNYIARLQEDIRARTAESCAMREALDEFRAYLLTSPKFGNRPVYDADGLPTPQPSERLDWIATSDVVARIEAIKSVGLEARENAT